MDRIEKQYIVFKYVEYQRLYDIYITANDEYYWGTEMNRAKTLAYKSKDTSQWQKFASYNLLTDMFDLSHNVKIELIKRFYYELYDELSHLRFYRAITYMKYVIKRLEQSIQHVQWTD